MPAPQELRENFSLPNIKMSIITKSITNADREARYLNLGELTAIQEFYDSGLSRLKLADILTHNESKIIEKASLKFWERCPNTPSNSGSRVRRTSCLRDLSWYMRLVTYSIVQGDIDPLTDIGVKGVKEMYNSLEIPLPNIVEAVRCVKEVTLEMLTLHDAVEVAPYFDYLIQSMKP